MAIVCSVGCGTQVFEAPESTTATTGTTGVGGKAASTCTAAPRASFDVEGVYFTLVDVLEPIVTQFQVYLAVRNAENGLVVRLTNADRNPICNGTLCPEGEACGPEGCTDAWAKPMSLEEHPLFVPNPGPPEGYGAAFTACLYDGVDGAVLRSDPFDIVVESPKLTLQAVVLTLLVDETSASPIVDGDFDSTQLYLDSTPSGVAHGGLHALRLAPDEIPDGVPQP